MPLDLTGIQNIGEFYSHHYLDALLENDLKGLFAKWREGDETTPDRHLYRLSSDFFKAKSEARPELSIQSRYEPSHRIHVALLEALGYSYSFRLRYINGNLAIPILGAMVRDGHEFIWLVETPFPGHDKLMEEDTSPFDQCLFRQQYPKTEEEFFIPESRWEDLIGDIFHTDEPPRWLVLFAGRFIYLIDRTKWGRGQYLLFDLDEILSRRQTQTLRATAALLSREAICPDDGVPLHDTLDENSHKHAYGVSSDLKYGLRRAVELLANEYVWYQRTVAKQALFQDEDLARKLTEEALTYLYRMLFLLYAEARGSELDVVPVKSEAYLKGYSLDALRDLEQIPLTTPQAQNGYYLNDSLNRLFSLVDEGHQPQQLALGFDSGAPVTGYDDYGFRVQGLHSPLFNRQSTPLLSSVNFRNGVLQEVIQLLSLSREKKSSKYQRGRISYAQLGINQLGAVYEALLSYSGFFAAERLYEVKPADAQEADETAQTYFIPESELERYLPDEFVYDSETGQRKSYEKGSFIFRLAGRDREKSASYYTPEVLTQCVVKYSLKELLKDKTADDILKITICEPAMGSGAFINEALNQLADAYLELKQKELGKRISPDDYRTERQKVKYFLAVNNAYGVDLNPTAVRLAEVSLWLNILFPDAPTPWFGARLATGNSLIGARRQVYKAEDVKSGAYTSQAPTTYLLTPDSLEDCETGQNRIRPEGTIYHWLLPDTGMASFDNDKVIKGLAPTETETINKWRNDFTKSFSMAEIKNLLVLSDQADVLWQKALDERQRFLENTRQPTPVWGQPQDASTPKISIEQREKELVWLQRPIGPLARLKMAMDYWCALWFWPILEAGHLPTRQKYLEDIAAIFSAGEETGFEKEPEQMGLFETPESKQTRFSDLKPVTINDLCTTNPRLRIAKHVGERQHLHHWELAFLEVFAERGGFDLILGNPPWIKVKWDESGILSDFDPYIIVKGFDAAKVSSIRSKVLSTDARVNEYLSEFIGQVGLQAFLSTPTLYHLISQVQTNLYKAFVLTKWWLSNIGGVSALLHDYGIYDDPMGFKLREEVYKRLRWVFRFYNELNLFPEESLGHAGQYCVSIFSNVQSQVICFNLMANLFHPKTVDDSVFHDGHGNMPGIKTPDGNWELRGHAQRIVQIRDNDLLLFARLFGVKDDIAYGVPLPIIHGSNVLHILETLSYIKPKLSDFQDHYYSTVMYEEKKGINNGLFVREVSFPTSTKDWVISGPHYYIGNPYAKNPRENCQSKGDYDEIDLTSIPENFIPRTIYKPTNKISNTIPEYLNQPITTRFRYINRKMAQPSNERTLISAIIPPDALHINSSLSILFEDNEILCRFAGLTCSIIYDFFIRITGKQNIMDDVLRLLPLPTNISKGLMARALRLNCISIFYSNLWKELYTSDFMQESWTNNDSRLKPWNDLTSQWQWHVALRTPFERRQALVEIDVLAASTLGLTLDELLTIYCVQFPVLQKNERRLRFDQRGIEVPMKTVYGELGPDESHPKFPEMVPPFTQVDREEDYRVAWKFFEEKLKKEDTGSTG